MTNRTTYYHEQRLWSYYPENSFAGNIGRVLIYNINIPAYGANPSHLRQMDTHNYYYWADNGARVSKPLNEWAKGMKENIYI